MPKDNGNRSIATVASGLRLTNIVATVLCAQHPAKKTGGTTRVTSYPYNRLVNANGMSFSNLGLSSKVLEAVEAAGYTEPTAIQKQAIPHALERRDVLGIAQTGTGKTASFTLPMLTLLEKGRARARMPRTLILEPTRELAAQVEEVYLLMSLT